MNNQLQLFTGKYRPKSLEEIILSDRIRKEIGDGQIKQNILFYGPQGSGKTSLAKILTKNLPTLYVNASDETGVDLVRTKIVDFCSSISVLDGKETIKVIFLDECDNLSDAAFKALRATIEKYSELGIARFIGTCNFINKVPQPIQDRFCCINFNPISKEEEKELTVKYIKRIMGLMKTLEITISKDAAIEFVKRNFPSMRSLVSKTQSFYDKGIKEISIEDIKVLNYNFEDVYKIIMTGSDPYANYVLLMGQYVNKVDDVMQSLGQDFVEYLREFYPAKIGKIPQILIEIAHYQAQRNLVIDSSISLLGLVFKLQTIVNQ